MNGDLSERSNNNNKKKGHSVLFPDSVGLPAHPSTRRTDVRLQRPSPHPDGSVLGEVRNFGGLLGNNTPGNSLVMFLSKNSVEEGPKKKVFPLISLPDVSPNAKPDAR